MKRKIFSVLFAVVLVLTLGLVTAVPAAGAVEVEGVELQTVGSATAEWSTEQKHSESWSAKLYVVNGGADWAEVSIPVDIAIENITELSFWEKIDLLQASGWDVNVILGVDCNDNGVFDSDVIDWHIGLGQHTTAALAGDSFVEMDGWGGLTSGAFALPVTYAGLSADVDWTEVDVINAVTYGWWTVKADGTGFAHFGTLIGGSFADYLAWLDGTNDDGLIDKGDRVKCVKLVLGGSSLWVDEIAYVDDVTINGVPYDFEPPPPTEVYVDNDWISQTDVDPGLFWGWDAFATIQDGIDAVAEFGTVNVAAGDYGERVTINKGLTLLGANAGKHPAVGTHPTETVETRGPESVLSELGTQVVKPYADDITIDGFKLISPYQAIYTYEDGNNFHLTNCIFENRTPVGETVVLFGSGSHTDMLIDFNLFQDPGDRNLYFGGEAAGIYDRLHIAYNKFNGLGESVFWAGETLVDGIIEGNEFDGTIDEVPGTGGPGLNIGKGGNIIIRNNWFHDMSYTGFQVGIIGGSVIKNTFEDTYPIFWNGNWYPSNAFELWGGEYGTSVSTDVTITGNTVKFNDQSNDADEHGFRLRPGVDAPNIHINANKFVDGGVSTTALAVRNQGTGIADAECNWWGDATGPDHADNPHGTGQGGAAVSDYVDFMPWYATETTTDTTEYVSVVHEVSSVIALSDTIQGGIDATLSGDTVDVVAGTYTENVVIDKWLTLQGAGNGSDPGSNTVITASAINLATIEIKASGNSETERLVVKDLRVTGATGSGNTGSGIIGRHVPDISHITFDHVASVGNEGGGIAFDVVGPVTDIVLNNCILSGNFNGFRLPSSSTASDITVNNCVFNNNVQGGIMSYAFLDGLTVDGGSFTGNAFGIMLGAESGEPRYIRNVDVYGATFDDNNKDPDYQFGFDVYVYGSTEHEVENINVNFCSFTNHDRFGVTFWDGGFEGYEDVVIDATYNWWGNPNGPSAAAFDIYSVGDAIRMTSGDVDYSPWLPGEWETYFDLEAEALIDSDGDGFSDLDEYWLGTDPNDDTSFPGATIDPGQVDNAYVEGDDPGEVNLQDSEGDPIADVDISGGGDASGTITGARYTKEPEEETGLSIGTGTTGVAFLDVKVTGYTEGIARITVPYPDVAPDDGIVDGTSIDETTLSLYYWDEATSTWLIADNNVVDTVNNNVSGDIPVSALAGTPVGMGGYLEDEAAVAIESILNLSYSGEDTVYLTIDTNTAFLGAATIDLIFDPRAVEVLAGENSDFDTLTVNLSYAVIGNDTQIARFVAHQEGEAGVDATGGVVVAVVKLNAVGSTMDESPLALDLVTLKDNKGDTIPFILGANDSIAIVGGIGDANRDGVVDSYDCVYIARAIAGFSGYSIDTPTMNVSGDLTVDAWDCTYLARHLVGIAGYEQLGG